MTPIVSSNAKGASHPNHPSAHLETIRRSSLETFQSRLTEKAFDRFVLDFGAKYPKAVAKRVKDRAALLAFYDFPAEHWVPIRTTNPIESSFATIRHRTTRTKNCVSRNTLLGLVFQLALTAEQSWRKLGGFKLLPAVVQGIRFVDGLRVTDQPPTEFAEEQQIAA